MFVMAYFSSYTPLLDVLV